jgi:serine protease Do
MGFAIPISRAIPIIEELMNRDTLTKVDESEQGTIGISGVTVTSDVSKAYNMPVGVYVSQILENGGAANSDLREGDIITAINGQTITSMEELQRQPGIS